MQRNTWIQLSPAFILVVASVIMQIIGTSSLAALEAAGAYMTGYYIRDALREEP